MLVFWIVMAALIYFLLLGMVLVFFASVGKVNERWEHAFREAHPDSHDHNYYRAA